MFILAQNYRFAPDIERSWLAAYAGHSMDLKWHLHLMSEANRQRVHSELAVESFGVDLNPQLGSRNWLELSGVEIETERSGRIMLCCDGFSQWDDLIDLSIRFGRPAGDRIEIFADGLGSASSFPEHFPSEEVRLEIQTWVRFKGVGLIVPPDSPAPHREAGARLAKISPGYRHGDPIFREVAHAGKSFGTEFFFPPAESQS